MRQESLFQAGPTVREKASPAAKAVEAFRQDNITCAKRALADPDYGYLQAWALIVLQKNGLLDESEAA